MRSSHSGSALLFMQRKYPKERVAEAVRESVSISGVAHYLGLTSKSGAAWYGVNATSASMGSIAPISPDQRMRKAPSSKKRSAEDILTVRTVIEKPPTDYVERYLKLACLLFAMFVALGINGKGLNSR
jgi:hypothetical protein